MRILVLLTMFASCAAPTNTHSTAASPSNAAAHSSVESTRSAAESTHSAVEPARSPEEIGSLRNARVAIERGADAPTLTYFAEELEPAQREELARLAPRIQVVTGLSRDAALARAGEAHGIDGRYATAEFVHAANRLVWVQAQSAGVERYLAVPGIASNDRVVLTNLRAVHGPTIADHAFAMLLALTRDLPVHLAGKSEGRWQREGSDTLEPIALQGRTLLVVGLGGIGSEIARRGDGFGMRVIATRRSDDPAPSFVERVGKPTDLLAMLPEADVVAICVPLTPETEHLFDRAAFAAMKRRSYVINIARGQVIDTDALVDALKSGHLAGACLDVTDPEPLPADHPLWDFPNVVITPHVASRAELTQERGWAVFRENLRRFDAGEPLLNVVDKTAGY
jgi:phosphoglycerate dehydrogenase-like enzyme